MSSIKRGILIFPILKDLNKADGILVKNEGIKKGFVENNIDIDVLEFNSSGIYNGNEMILPFSSNKFVRMYEYHIQAWKKIEKYLNKNHYDFIWFRVPMMLYPIASFIRNLKNANSNTKIILEYGAYPFLNELTTFKQIIYKANKKNELIAHNNADYVITYCGQKEVDGLLNIPIDNGIDIDSIQFNEQKPSLSSGINFISVSSLKKWHAYERFIQGMALYVNQPDAFPMHFNIVGDGPELPYLKKLVIELNLQQYVTFHKFKTGKELEQIYDQNHIAIGTLGFHRIGITSSSSLKNREYFARGLPVVLSTPDKDMPANLEFVKYVPENEEAVDINKIVLFSREMYNKGSINKKIRKYAEDNLSWKSKIQTVLSFLQNSNYKELQDEHLVKINT